MTLASSRSSSKEARAYAGGQIYAWVPKKVDGHDGTGGGRSGGVKVFEDRARGLRSLRGGSLRRRHLARVQADRDRGYILSGKRSASASPTVGGKENPKTRSANRPQMFIKRCSERRSKAWHSHREGDTRSKRKRRDRATTTPRIPGPLAPRDVTGKLFGDKPNA